MAPHYPQPLILASASPRRARLLRDAGYEFEVVAASAPEPVERDDSRPPRQRAEALAYFKARGVAATHPGATLLGADTLVELDGEAIGKARDAEDARGILSRLSGSRHHVITGVAIVDSCGARRLIRHDVTEIQMRPMSPDDIEAYIHSGEWRDKAGAYAIQETGDRQIERITGSWSNVVGLPMELLERMWVQWQDMCRE